MRAVRDKWPSHSIDRNCLRDFRLIIRASFLYEPITAILYTSRTGTLASVTEADSI